MLRYGASGLHLDRPGQLGATYGVVALTVCAAAAIGVGLGTILRGSSAALFAVPGSGALESVLLTVGRDVAT
ncbi:hypothetical protein FAIPA1_90046 [Frankia sp. AiPs1]|uniref:hypothetical protein n=1 Tax=Frankia sp. AiPa1 TaxID=573492 RepID=UPI00202B9AA1|nr:hypothetical protein [Frankia sp. AiPa1]MCL9760751.1 hypothetical protein [Frankia sp. AiPa1]